MNVAFTPWLQFIGLLALEGAVIVGVALQLERLRQSAAWRRMIWHVCVLSLSLLVLFEFTGMARDWAGWVGHASKRVSLERPDSVVEFKSQGVVMGKVNGSNAEHPTSNAERRSEGAQVAINPNEKVKSPSTSLVTGVGKEEIKTEGSVHLSTNPVAITKPAKTDFRPLWVALPALLWLLGIVVVLGRVLFARFAFEIFRQRQGQVNEESLRAMLDKLASRMGIRWKVRLLESDRICGPIAFGWLRPTIALPVGFAQKFTALQQEAMLAHELAHLAGRDAAWYLLADILSATLWWHPLVWRVRHQLHAASELMADEASLLVANGPSVLAECLVEIGTRLTQRRAFRQMGVEGSGFRSGLGRRVERLIHLEGNTWCPSHPLRGGLARVLGPMLLVTATIFCTAWVIPPALTKGDNMKTIHQTWKQPLAALALLASIHSTTPTAQAGALAAPPAVVTAANTLPAANPTPAPAVAPVSQVAVAIDAAPVPVVIVTSQKPAPENNASPFGGGGGFPSKAPTPTESQRILRDKLDNIFIDKVEYDGLPLTEVVNQLVDIASKNDSTGINFVLNRERTDVSGGMVDPTTGLPMAAQNFEWSSVTVTLKPALKHVRFIDFLEVLVKSTDQPIKYSVENYGVVFSQDTTKVMMNTMLPTIAASQSMEVKMFKVGASIAFVELLMKYGGGDSSKDVSVETAKKFVNEIDSEVQRGDLVRFLSDFGLDKGMLDKSLLYSKYSGIVMVRASKPDMEVISAAMETMLGPGAVVTQQHAAR